ncbi:tyrosine-type recombinase/integrase [Streptomyces ginkgonis]|uniref:tyrosine-type recombinase/integrase n=1 Tax=Streptomyces ginkgonis TaxID=1812259 RepID=UPI002176E9FF|nr:site-specific integrase [Streptomyces ginkgonis]
MLDDFLAKHQGEATTKAGYEPKIRLHIKPHIGDLKITEVTDDTLDDLYRQLEKQPCPTNGGKPLGPKTVRHVHNIISGAFSTVVPKLLPANPAAFAHPPTERQIKAAVPDFPVLSDAATAAFLGDTWKPCGNRACHRWHHCLRDAPLWTSYTATGCRRSECLGWKWDLIDWEKCSIRLDWVVVEVGSGYILRRLTKDGDKSAVIYFDPALKPVLQYQWDAQDYWKKQLGPAWVDHGLVFARDGFKLQGNAIPGGPQDPDKVSSRWRTKRQRLGLPDEFRLHDWRASKINNDLDAGENPVEVSANARHGSPGYTMKAYGRRRAEAAKQLAAASAGRVGLNRAGHLLVPGSGMVASTDAAGLSTVA